MPAELPSGTVTLLFTDIEGSTRMLQELGREAYVRALTEHRRLLREAFTSHGGVEVEMQGDSFHFAFPYARDAVAAALAGQHALARHSWESQPIKVRIGLHTGEPMQADGLYAGLDVHHAARIMSAAHGGQVLLSARTADLVDGELEIELVDLGEHRLKDLLSPQRLYQAGEGAFPPANTLSGSRTNLPVQPTPLLGRERELRELGGLLANPEVHLLTLTGPGGTGKTRLALQLAADHTDDYPDGVFACFLAPLRDPTLVLPTVATAIGLREQPGRAVSDILVEHVSTRRLLIVLDNLEQLLEAAPALADLLAGAPELSLLVTSRSPLRIAGEHRYDVPPLSLPDESTSGSELLRSSGAVALFCARARAVRSDFELTDQNAAQIVEIARRVDGLPLALELAAARADVLPPHALLSRLDRTLPLLGGGRRDADERQRTLRGAIEWSYELLDEDERVLFRRLSVLVGPFTIDVAEAVARDASRLDALTGIASLHEKSLLRTREGHDNEPRFFMLETIREYAAERADERGETAELCRVRGEHFLELAERGAEELTGPRQVLWLDRFDSDHHNLRAALAHALEIRDADTALRFVGALHRFWDLRGYPSEGFRWACAALALEGGARESRASALFGAGFNAYSLGLGAESVAYLEAALESFRAIGDERSVVRTLAELSWSRLMRGDERTDIAALARDALDRARALGERWSEALALQALAATGEPERQVERLYASEAIFREAGDEIYASRILQNLCLDALKDGLYDDAREFAERGLASSRRFGDVVLVALNQLSLGEAELLAGDSSRAADVLRRALETMVEIGNRAMGTEAIFALAAVAATQGDLLRAARLQGAAERLSQEYRLVLTPPVDRLFDARFVRPLRGRDPSAFDEARDEGRRLPFEAAVELALGLNVSAAGR